MASESSLAPVAEAAASSDEDLPESLSDMVDKARSMASQMDGLPAERRLDLLVCFRDLLWVQYQHSKGVTVLDEAIAIGETVLALSQGAQEDRAGHLKTLAFMRLSRYQITSSKPDIDDAVELGRQAKALSSPSDPNWIPILSELGYALSVRYQMGVHGGQLGDLEEAIQCSRQALRETPPETAMHKTFVHNLGARLILKSKATGDLSDANEALSITEQVLAQTIPGTHEYLAAQQNIICMLQKKYQRTKYWRDLSEATRMQRLIIERLDASHEFWPKACTGLASLLEDRYDSTRDLDDFREAVASYREAVVACPILQSPQSTRGHHLLQYLSKLKRLMDHVMDASEIKSAIDNASALIDLMPPVFEGMESALRCLGQIMSRGYEVSGQIYELYELVQQAISVASWLKEHESDTPRYDISALLALFHRVSTIIVKSQDDYIVMQVVKATHKEYCRLIKEKDFIQTLISIQKDVSIEVQMVCAVTTQTTNEELTKEMNSLTEFAKSLGAGTGRFRVKMMDMTLKPAEAESKSGSFTSDLSTAMEKLRLPGTSAAGSAKRNQGLMNVARKAYDEAQGADNAYRVAGNFEDLAAMNTLGKEMNRCLLEMSGDLSLEEFNKTKNVEHLERSVLRAKESLELDEGDTTGDETKPCWNGRRRLLCNLCHSLRSCYLETRNEKWLTDAFIIGSAAVRETASTGPEYKHEDELQEKSASLIGLSNVLKSRYQLYSRFYDLEQAISLAQESIALDEKNTTIPVDSKAVKVNQLALMMRLRCQRTGEMENLKTGITSVEAFAKDNQSLFQRNPELGCALTGNLGLMYNTKAERTKDLEDMDKAIEHCRTAVNLSAQVPMYSIGSMQNLANGYLERYHTSNNTDDLRSAAELANQIVDMALKQGLRRTETLADAASIMQENYLYTKDAGELQTATLWMKEAVSLLQPTATTVSAVYLTYGCILEENFKLKRSEKVLQECIDAYEKSATRGIGGEETMHSVTSSCRLYRLLLSEQKWEAGLKQMRILTELIARRCPRWLPAADQQYMLSRYHNVPSDIAAAILRLPQASGTAYDALRCLEVSRGIFIRSIMDVRSEAKLTGSTNYEHLISDWHQLCMQLDACLDENLSHNETSQRQVLQEDVIKVIETIRSIPHFQGFSPPLDPGSLQAMQLRQASPELYHAYEFLQRELELLPPGEEREAGHRTKRQRELSTRMDEMVARIRGVGGLENFLLPPTEDEVTALAHNGPIVIVTSSEAVGRSNAIIVTETSISSMVLPDLHYQDVRNHMQSQREALTGWTVRNFAQKNKKMRDVLLWLWECAVEPILDRLEMTVGRLEQRPHIHWIGTGLLSSAPFHAAGDHSEGSTANTMSRARASYVCSIRALSFARDEPTPQEHAVLRGTRKHALVVSVPDAPGAKRLAAVDEEAESVADIAAPHAAVVRLKAPDPAAVMRELPLANIVHLACHAVPDVRDISDSHLLLMPGDESSSREARSASQDPSPASSSSKRPGPGKLTIRRIRARPAASAELVYLSACSAAENRAAMLADESLHIASAFQMAGFRHVVGTLWQAKDRCCREVAESFYRFLFAAPFLGEEGGGGGGGEAGEEEEKAEGGSGRRDFATRSLPVVEALDKAVWELRDRNPERVLDWAPFIHIGA